VRTLKPRPRLLVPALVLLVGLGIGVGTLARPQPAAKKPGCPTPDAGCTFVDRDSLGGRCSDRRTAAVARSEATPWCTLRRALRAAPAGSTVVVRAGRYPWLHIADQHRDPAITLRAHQGERVVLPDGFAVERSSGFRLQGFRMTSRENVSTVVASERVAILGGDFSPLGLVVRGVRDTTIARNRIHNLQRGIGPEGFDGYGIWANGVVDGGPADGTDGLVIRDNTFDHITQDGVQIGGGTDLVTDITIQGNEFGFVRRGREADHSDPIQIMGGRGIIIRDNYFHDSEDAIIAADGITEGLKVINNLMVGWKGGCIQAQFWNTPGAQVLHNTIWRSQCLGLRFAFRPEIGPAPSGIVVSHNVLDSYDPGDPTWITVQDHNAILHGPRRAQDRGGPPGLTKDFRPGGLAARLHAGSTVRIR
jgi:hypothetical protein